MRLDDIIKQFDTLLDRADLEDFIARGWVKPAHDETDFVFTEIDVARVQLVCDLHHDMDLEVENLDLVLSLMDQLYEARSKLNLVTKAVAQQPDMVQQEILSVMQSLQTDD